MTCAATDYSREPIQRIFSPKKAPAITLRPLADLTPYANNARTHTREQIVQLAASIREFGWTNPILVDGASGIIAGHGRVLAAQLLGLTEVPVIELAHLTSEQKRAYVLADNKLALNAGWDMALVRLELDELQAVGFDLALTGFTVAEFQPAQPRDPDAAPPLAPAVTKLGDVWQLGPHCVVCGDATKPATLAAALPDGAVVNLVFTDPPYGMSYEPETHRAIRNDDLRRDQLQLLLAAAFKVATARCAPTAAWYIWHAEATRADFLAALQAAALEVRDVLIWVKPSGGLGNADYRRAHEPCLYAGAAGQEPAFYGDRGEITVWRAAPVAADGVLTVDIGNGVILTDGSGGELVVQRTAAKGRKLRHVRLPAGQATRLESPGPHSTVWEVGRDHRPEHPTQKPVELAQRAIRNSTQPGELVLDLFAGVGSTLLAAEVEGRRASAVELDPRYVDCIVRRWQQFTGESARRVADGQTFAEAAGG